MREETLEVAGEQPLVKGPVEEFVADVFEENVAMEEPADEMVETILGDEYFVTEESKSVQKVATSQEPDYMELLAELQSRFICLQYEFRIIRIRFRILIMSIVTGIRSILLLNPMYHEFWISLHISINGRLN